MIGNTLFFSALAGIGLGMPTQVTAGGKAFPGMKEAIGALEKARGGRLGVAILDTATGAATDWRGDERFGMCSTFKFLLAGYILSRVDAGQEQLDRIIPFGKQDLVQWSPLTEPHAGKGMSVEALCEAIIIQSDNTGANVLMRESGGPDALTGFLRRIGDEVTRIDRIEPEMNKVPPGEQQDTTTPLSMLGLMRTLLLGTVLTPAARQRLTAWLIDNRTGGARLRAGLPGTWRVGDKTGSYGPMTHDIAILWPPAGGPLLLTSYYWNQAATADQRNAVHAELAALVARFYPTV
ncbi:class A beta-lactamase [Niveispirillum sp. KHB5.9]|uniref:class A beta-lactamase n=1 Tax=Niveispirillum sp. KHB5.9 TaxID=3400269 RepID=UPI003A854B2D